MSSFVANWSATLMTSGYFLDVATDAGFTSFVNGFQNLRCPGTSRLVSGLAPSTEYFYRVRAFNDAGVSGNSNTIDVTTLAVPVTISNQSISTGNLYPAGATAAYRLGSDGIAYESVDGVTFTPISGEWLDYGDNVYECRMTVVSGAFTSGTVGQWLPLDSDRTWTITVSADGGTESVSATLEIRQINTVNTLDSATIALVAESHESESISGEVALVAIDAGEGIYCSHSEGTTHFDYFRIPLYGAEIVFDSVPTVDEIPESLRKVYTGEQSGTYIDFRTYQDYCDTLSAPQIFIDCDAPLPTETLSEGGKVIRFMPTAAANFFYPGAFSVLEIETNSLYTPPGWVEGESVELSDNLP